MAKGLTAAAMHLLLGARLPRTKGEIAVEGVRGPIAIRRDGYGIPHIEAEGDDAWFGLGFCQAQDRAFQLELRLRLVRGTLSALIGPQTLAIDRLARRIGFREAGERQLAALDPDVRAQGEAFVRGINAGLRTGLRRKPHEFVLLRGRPTPWEAADVVGIGKMMSFLLLANWDVELARLQILRLSGAQALRDLDPLHADATDGPDGSRFADAAARLEADIGRYLEYAGPGGGSNNWVVAGRKTKSGRPILANDPHLEPALPPHWYLAHLVTPDWSVAGGSLIGSPGFGFGHNGFCAWGLTAGFVDTVDLFLEEIGSDGRSVREGDAFVPCEVRREVIEIRGKPLAIEEVLVTARGPVIGPALTPDVGAISMRAGWLDAKPARGFLKVHESRSFAEFRGCFEKWPLLNQNVVYADETGDIGWVLAGESPVRRRGSGLIPSAGWETGAGWEDEPVPFAEMPYRLNPEAGFIATANSAPEVDAGAPYLGADFLDSYRRDRIAEALAARYDWDTASTLGLQMDETVMPWREIRDVVLAAPAGDSANAAEALEVLRAWDGVASVDSAATSVYELFVAAIRRRIAVARAPGAADWALGRGFTPLVGLTTFALGRLSNIVRRLREQPPGWFEEGWPAVITACLAEAVGELHARYGDAGGAWRWGHIRTLTLHHPLGRIKPLAPVFNRGPYPWGGDGNTISQAGTAITNRITNPLVIASARMAVEAGDWENARFVLPGGQSGNPFSPHYDDLLPAWLAGDGVPIAWSPDAMAAATTETLRLRPA